MTASTQQVTQTPEATWRISLTKLKAWISDKELGREFWIFFFGALCFDFGFAIFFFLFNLFLLDVGFSVRQLGLVTGAMTIGGVVGTIPVGLLARRVKLHRLLLAGFILAPAVSVLRAYIVPERAQIGLAAITGLCFSLWTVCFSPAAASLTSEKNRTFGFSLLFSAGIGMGVLGGMVGGFLPGWLQQFWPAMQALEAKRAVLLLCCLIVAVGIWPISRLRLQVEQEKKRKPWTFDPFLFRFLPAVALWSLVIGGFSPLATAYLSRYIHIPLTHIGLIFSASQLAQVLAVLIAPAIFKRFGLVTGIMYTQLATALALGVLAQAHLVSVVVVVYLGFTAFQWMSGPGIYSLLMNRVPESERSSASAANIFVTSLFQAIASAVSGAGFGKFGYPAGLLTIAGVAFVAALLFRTLLHEPEGCTLPEISPS
ncbi:MAG TPA: MFS transporter [Acidobacteriaceae bacterium]